MSLGKFTYGAELEFVDWDTTQLIPPWCGKLDPKDSTLVNSDGHANDPTLKTSKLGGEINTLPSKTIDQQIKIAKHLIDLLNPNINYRCNLHIHIGVEGLAEDINLLKKLFQYTLDNQDYVFNEVLPLKRPTKEEWPDPDDFDLAKKFFRQQNFWAKSKVPMTRVPKILAANSPRQFYDEHFHYNEVTKKRQYSIAIVRAGINIRSLFKHGTVEFRIFPATLDIEQIEECFKFSHYYMKNALSENPLSVRDWYTEIPKKFGMKEWNLPDWPKFQPELERKYKQTKIDFPMEYPTPGVPYKRLRDREIVSTNDL